MRERLANNAETTQHTSLCLWDDLAQIWFIVFLFTILSISQFRLFFSQFWIYILQLAKFWLSHNLHLNLHLTILSLYLAIQIFSLHSELSLHFTITTFIISQFRLFSCNCKFIYHNSDFLLRIVSYKHLAVIFCTCLYLTILFISCYAYVWVYITDIF